MSYGIVKPPGAGGMLRRPLSTGTSDSNPSVAPAEPSVTILPVPAADDLPSANETARHARPDRPGGVPRRESPPPPAGYFASGSGRSWKCATLLGVPLPVSVWNGARVP